MKNPKPELIDTEELEGECVVDTLQITATVAHQSQRHGCVRRLVNVRFDPVTIFASDRPEHTNAWGDQIEGLVRDIEDQAKARILAHRKEQEEGTP